MALNCWTLALAALACLVPWATSFDSGPPAFTPDNNPKGYTYCESTDFYPRHGNHAPQPSSSVSGVDILPVYNAASHTFTVTLNGTVGGFIVQGRDEVGVAHGSFLIGPDQADLGQIVTGCGGRTTIGHTNPNGKLSPSFEWAPPMEAGEVTFYGTFVQPNNFAVFWPTEKSVKMNYEAAPTTQPPVTDPPVTDPPTTTVGQGDGNNVGGGSERHQPFLLFLAALTALTYLLQ